MDMPSSTAARLAALPADDGAPDEAILARVRGGDATRFALLVRRYNQRLFRAARAILGDDGEAEDAVQQAYVQAYRGLEQFRGEASFSTWLTRIVVRVAASRGRAQRRRNGLAPIVPMREETHDVRDDAHSPEDVAAAHQLRRLLERHIDALPEGLRAVFVLRDVEELPTAETAACLGLSDEAVRVRLHRARHQLRESLAGALGAAAADAYHFAGERCDRLVLAVLDAIEPR